MKTAPAVLSDTIAVEAEINLWDSEHSAMQQDSPFHALGFKPDNWTAYAEMKFCHTMPVVAGPTMKGNYLAYHPAVVARSFQSFQHKQINIEHKIKSYAPKQIARDRIIGAIVAVHYPPGAISQIPASGDDAACIRVMLAIFKQAEGVQRIIGNHQSSREIWSGSIEVVYRLEELGIFQPSTREVWNTIAEAPKGMREAVTADRTGHLLIGQYKGEQLAFAIGGINGSFEGQGAGMTRFPAEREAELVQILASSKMELPEGMMAEAASVHPLLMFQRGAHFRDARGHKVRAAVRKIFTEGKVKVPGVGYTRQASEERPILHIVLPDGGQQLRTMESVQPA